MRFSQSGDAVPGLQCRFAAHFASLEALGPEALFKAVATDASSDSCSVAYGRPLCQDLAQQDPAKALMNADSFGYYVLDAGNPETFGVVPELA